MPFDHKSVIRPHRKPNKPSGNMPNFAYNYNHIGEASEYNIRHLIVRSCKVSKAHDDSMVWKQFKGNPPLAKRPVTRILMPKQTIEQIVELQVI